MSTLHRLPESLARHLGRKQLRQRFLELDGQPVLVVHQVPRRGEKQREPVVFWRLLPQGPWENSLDASGLGALSRVAAMYEERLTALENRAAHVHGVRERIEVLGEMAPVLRSLGNLMTALQSARDKVQFDPVLVELAESVYSLHRGLELLELDVQHSLELVRSYTQEDMAEVNMQVLQSSQRLNVVTSIFLPLTAISGVFGMNLSSGIPEQRWLFWAVFIGGLCIGAIVCAWVIHGVNVAQARKTRERHREGQGRPKTNVKH